MPFKPNANFLARLAAGEDIAGPAGKLSELNAALEAFARDPRPQDATVSDLLVPHAENIRRCVEAGRRVRDVHAFLVARGVVLSYEAFRKYCRGKGLLSPRGPRKASVSHRGGRR